jgi:hypothetical protein
MVVVKASVFVAAVIGLLGNVGMAVSSADGESSQPLSGVLSSDCVGWFKESELLGGGISSLQINNDKKKGVLGNVFECTNPLTVSLPETSDLQLVADNMMYKPMSIQAVSRWLPTVAARVQTRV